MILFVSPFGPLATNVILIGCEATKKALVVDPAYHSTPWILQKAQERSLEIEKILLTHSHWDHFADADVLQKKTHAEVFAHRLDQSNLEHPGTDGIPSFVPILPVIVDHFVQDGEIIAVGTLSFRVIHTPGHSPGGVCYYEEKHQLLLAGDTLFKGTIGALHLPTANAEAMRASIKKLSALPKDVRVIPGHGAQTTIGQEEKTFQNAVCDF